MPVVKQNIVVQVAGGLETSVDPKLLQPGAVIEAENVRLNRRGEYVKRTGTQALTTACLPSGVAQTDVETWQLASYRGSLLNIPKTNSSIPIMAYLDGADGWTRPPAIANKLNGQASVSLVPVWADDFNSAKVADIAYASGYAYLAFRDANAVTRLMAIDLADNRPVWQYTVPPPVAHSCRVLVVGTQVVFLATTSSASSVAAYAIPAGTAAITVTAHTFLTDVGTGSIDGCFDAAVKDSTTFTVAYKNASNAVKIANVSTATWTVGTVITPTLCDATVLLTFLRDLGGSGKRLLATVGSVNGIRLTTISANDSYFSLTIDNPGGTMGTIQGLIGYTTDSNGAHWHIFSEIGGDPAYTMAYDRQINAYDWQVAGTLAWTNTVSIASQPWIYNGASYCVVSYGSPLATSHLGSTQPTDFVIKLADLATPMTSQTIPPPIARFGTWKGAGWLDSTVQRPHVQNLGDGAFLGVSRLRPRVELTKGAENPVNGLYLSTITFDPSLGAPAEGESLYIPGGITQTWDGFEMSELGFHLQPEKSAQLAPYNTTSGTMPLGTFKYYACFRRKDNLGRVFRSASTLLGSATLSGIQNACHVTINTLSMATKPLSTEIEIYRTSAGEELAHRIAIVPNDPTVLSITFDDKASDTDAEGSELLYTTGGILSDDPPPPSKLAAIANERLWLVSSDDARSIWASKPLNQTTGPGFSESLVVDIREGGEITAITRLDDKVIAFKRDRIYAVTGDGPDNAGNGFFNPPILVATNSGTINPRAVAIIPDGVIYQSTSGRLHFMNRGLGVDTTFGLPVDKYRDETIVDTVVLPKLMHVRFITASGLALVFDWLNKQWMVDTDLKGPVSAVAWNDEIAYVGSDGLIYVGTHIYSEAGTALTESITFPFLSFAGLNGVQVVDRMIGVGETVAPTTLMGDVWYDGDEGEVPAESRELAVVPDGGGPSPWSWGWKLGKKRCSSAKFRISEESFGAGFKISGFSILVGMKPGSRPIGVGSALR